MEKDAARQLLLELGQRIASQRRAHGLTQERLSERLNVSVGYVRRVEGGGYNLTIRTIAKVARAIGVPVTDLLDVKK